MELNGFALRALAASIEFGFHAEWLAEVAGVGRRRGLDRQWRCRGQEVYGIHFRQLARFSYNRPDIKDFHECPTASFCASIPLTA
jgi:hypothetical protein